MLQCYEQKGRKIYFGFIVGFIIIFTFAFYVGKFVTMRSMQTEEAVIAQVDDASKIEHVMGQVDYIEGTVELRTSSTDGWHTVSRNHVLARGEELRTLAHARAIVTFEDGTSVRLNENTQILFENNAEQLKIAVVQGEVYNRVVKNDARPYVVQTKDHVITALGTEFDVEAAVDTTAVLVVESSVSVYTNDGQELDRIQEGQKAVIVQDRVDKKVIADADLKDDFMMWSTKKESATNSIEEQKIDDVQKEKRMRKKMSDGKIVLRGETSDNGVRLHWSMSDIDAPHGVKIVKSKTQNPVYPGDDYQYISDYAIYDHTWQITTGEKYHFRVCVYDGAGACLLYSNDIFLDTPSGDDRGDDEGYATAVTLSAKEDDGDVKLSWEIKGGKAPKGFKIVKSKEKDPVYPGDDYQYIGDGDDRSYVWKGFSKGKIYHFRVCIYKGGSCGAYSNDVKVSF